MMANGLGGGACLHPGWPPFRSGPYYPAIAGPGRFRTAWDAGKGQNPPYAG